MGNSCISLLLQDESRSSGSLKRLERNSEHCADDQGGLGRSQVDPSGSKRAGAVPLVLDGGSAGTLHVLLGVLCS